MKKLTQVDLSNLSDKYTWLAINKHGELHAYEEEPVPCDTASGYEDQLTAILLGSAAIQLTDSSQRLTEKKR